MKPEKFLVVYAISFMLLIGLIAVVQPTKAQFVFASWDYPDGYGQGLQQIRVNENSTGSWVLVDVRTSTNTTNSYEWEGGVAIQLYVWLWLNSTITGASDLADGRNQQQCNVTVISLGEIIFSQQNFTFQDENAYGAMYLYEYDVVLNFIPVSGTAYTITVTYEVFY